MEYWMKRISWLAALALSGIVVVAEQRSVMRLDGTRIAVADIDAAVTRLMSAAEVTGVGLAIFNDRRPVYMKAYGVRDKEKNLPLTENSVMTAASLTKSTFAYMVLQLVDEGVINLDTPVQDYLPRPLPEYPGYKGLARDVRYKRITPRMLLDHSSGFAKRNATARVDTPLGRPDGFRNRAGPYVGRRCGDHDTARYDLNMEYRSENNPIPMRDR
jgi:CubicO group peptidase (beta-lactamase class C family)